MNANHPDSDRRTDLDALRAAAMLLGIVLHASLSFFPSYWMVADSRQAGGFGILFAAIHGFRMPLFFIMSGYFSALLLARRGRGALVKHRFRRVFLPLLAGMVTIVPLTVGVSTLALEPAARTPVVAPSGEAGSTLWAAARAGDLGALERLLASGAAVDAADPKHGGPALLWAAVAGRTEAIELLLRRGANVNVVDREGATALHAAAFLGHATSVDALLGHGANANAANQRGERPLDGAVLDAATTRAIAPLLGLEVEENGLQRRKAEIVASLLRHGAIAGKNAGVVNLLMQTPVFHHLWFLWFLWWLVLGYAGVSALAARLPALRLPAWLVESPARCLWLIPLTMLVQQHMGDGGSASFGPDTSIGLLPIPHVLAYYAIFFGFGALHYRAEDQSAGRGRRWWLPLLIGLLVVLPLALALTEGWPGPAGFELGPVPRRVLAVFLQAAYPWLVCFGLMGLFRRVCRPENATLRYLSDSAYWLYLAHLPLVIAAQLAVRDWPIPAILKFVLIVAVVTGFLLWTYQVMVRYTVLGRFLNGPRTRRGPTG